MTFRSPSRYLSVSLLAASASIGATCHPQVSDSYVAWSESTCETGSVGRLGTDDRIELRVFREEELGGEYVVPQAGPIQFPLIGAVELAGRTCGEVEAELAQRLGDGYVRSPTVTCRVLEVNSVRVTVIGEVSQPGRFLYTDGLTLIEVLALSQGLTENANKETAVVTRQIEGVPTEISAPIGLIMKGRAPDLRLCPSDTIFVPTYSLIP